LSPWPIPRLPRGLLILCIHILQGWVLVF